MEESLLAQSQEDNHPPVVATPTRAMQLVVAMPPHHREHLAREAQTIPVEQRQIEVKSLRLDNKEPAVVQELERPPTVEPIKMFVAMLRQERHRLKAEHNSNVTHRRVKVLQHVKPRLREVQTLTSTEALLQRVAQEVACLVVAERPEVLEECPPAVEHLVALAVAEAVRREDVDSL